MQKTRLLPPSPRSGFPKSRSIFPQSEGLIHAIEGETGKTLWIAQIGNPLYPTTAPAANDEYVGVCNGSTLYVMSAADGSVKFSRPTIGIPGAGPALSHDYIFVPMVSGQMVSRRLDDPKKTVGNYKSFGRTMTQPVISPNSVAWSTDSGNLYVGVANGAGIRFRMQAAEAAAAAPGLLAPTKCSSPRSTVTCIASTRKRATSLRFATTGEPITHPPVTQVKPCT